MARITFDTLKLARKLEAAGFPQRQAADTAAALAQSLGEVSDLATKADLAELSAHAFAAPASPVPSERSATAKLN